jgi:hypothetical protein
MQFHFATSDIRWEGRDSTTPEGHYLARGLDAHGDMRVWLFVGDSVTIDGYRGSILVPRPESGGRPIAYGPRGGYVTSQGDTAAMLARLAANPLP